MQVGRADVLRGASTALMLACSPALAPMLQTLQSVLLVDDAKL